MVNLSVSAVISTKSEGEIRDTVWSDELDHVPLTVRRKMLLAIKPHVDTVVKTEDKPRHSQGVFSFPSACSAVDERYQDPVQEQNHAIKVPEGVTPEIPYSKNVVDSGAVDWCLENATCGQYVCMLGDCNNHETRVNTDTCSDQKSCPEANVGDVEVEKVDVGLCILAQNSTLSKVPARVQVECFDNSKLSSSGLGIHGTTGDEMPAVKVKNEVTDDLSDDLDHIVLKERQRMLLPRKLMGLAKPVLEGDSAGLLESLTQLSHGKGNEINHSVDGKTSVAGNQFNDILERSATSLCRTPRIGSSNGNVAGSSFTTGQYSPLPEYCLGSKSSKSRNDMEIHESDRIHLSKRKSAKLKSYDGQNYLPGNTNSMHSSTLSTSVKVKDEPLDNNDMLNSVWNAGDTSFNMIPVKSELENSDEVHGDAIDHMCLRDRMKLLISGEECDLNISKNFECLRKNVPSDFVCSPVVSESVKPISSKHPRKRKKTATDSVETALEEDAPGLLQVLIDKGVMVDEIKLYGETENDEPLDESFSEDSFSDLEAVISKLFSQRNSFLKFAPIRCAKSSKASYCLACLISLVEQTRYLQFRKWPVEWGWCRDLQSFIFVFKKHNRIVLERPEYGYATYFFELVDSLPIDWQIKRLVTAMKLTSCGRVTLIENKALLVGEDLTEGEARVLMEYGWTPNSGLGTMLNYCDRVVHDRKNEDRKNEDISEWRSKIGKLLMNGYNGGSIVSNDTPHKVMECRGAQSPEIKLEL